MSKYNLSFISDENLVQEVENVLRKVAEATEKVEIKLYNNKVDPFSAAFDSIRQKMSIEEWFEQEKVRQIQKSMQNAVGDFHQAVLGHVDGWSDLKVGGIADLRNNERKIVAEVKNKFNTTKGNHKKVIYDDLEVLISTLGNDYTGYYVEIIPSTKKPYDKPFVPSDNVTKQRRPENEHIRVIDGKSFYALVTGEEDALRKLYNVLPTVISDVLQNKSFEIDSEDLGALFEKVYE